MEKQNSSLWKHPELRLLLLLIGYSLFSWPIFSGTPLSVTALYMSLFLFWGVAVVMLYFSSKSR